MRRRAGVRLRGGRGDGYGALCAASRGWHESRHNLAPWWDCFLGTLVAAYREFEQRVGIVQAARGAKTDMVRDAVKRLPSVIRLADLKRVCVGVSDATVTRVLRDLRDQGVIEVTGSGPGGCPTGS
ncbi:MAG: winged helix-turn-helix domain-containing protein [Armatimonadetes bacterium]|nr:winged helix-turn-helix domain-containing protein [Armatimonadota bacterium]